MSSYSIGVDLGGTNLRAAAMSAEGQILLRVEHPTPDVTSGHAVVQGIVDGVEAVRTQMGQQQLAGVGIGVPGFILMEKGIVVGSGNLPGLDNYPIRDEIEARLKTPVILENDANAAALGEYWMGAGRGWHDLILLTLGTGVGGGIVINGQILHGFLGMAGELGHMTIVPNGYPCGCGGNGCLEKYASATAVSAMAKLLNLGDLSAKEVFELAEAGNQRARVIFESAGTALGTAIANLTNIFNPPLFLLGGGMTAGWDLFAPSMLAEAKRRSFTFRSRAPEIKPSALGADSGIFGAAYLPIGAKPARN